MRIAHLIDSFSPLSEIWLYHLIQALQAQGVENYVLTQHRVCSSERPFENVTVFEMQPRWSLDRICAALSTRIGLIPAPEQYFAMMRRWLRQKIESLRPDVIHAHFAPQGVLVAPVANELRIPLIVGFYGYDFSQLPHIPYWRMRYQQLIAQANMVIAPSHFACSKVADIGFAPQQIRLQQWGIPLNAFHYQDVAQTFDGKHIRCLHVGRLVEKKSPVLLVQAFALAHEALKSDFNLTMTIVGEGSLKDAVATKIRELRLEGKVHLLNSVAYDQVPQLMNQSHIYTQYAQTSANGDQEAQGLTFVEASASGLPVISTQHNGIPDVVLDGQTGYLVPEGDYEAMGQRLIELCRNPSLWTQFGKAGREHVEKNFDLTKQVARMRNLYTEVIRNPAGRQST